MNILVNIKLQLYGRIEINVCGNGQYASDAPEFLYKKGLLKMEILLDNKSNFFNDYYYNVLPCKNFFWV